MTEHVDRRRFLSGGLALLGSSALIACDRGLVAPLTPEATHGRTHTATWPVRLTVTHSGSLDDPGHAVVGTLMTATPGVHEPALQDLREQGGYYFHRRLRYSSNDQIKLAYARAAIDYVLGAEGVLFEARVIGPGNHGGKSGALDLYQRLITEVAGVDARGFIEVRPTTSVGIDPELRDHLDAAFTGLGIGVEPGPSNLLQLTDLLTGSVYGDASGTRLRHPQGSGVKDMLSGHLREQLDVPILTDQTLADHPTFRVRTWRPPFSGTS